MARNILFIILYLAFFGSTMFFTGGFTASGQTEAVSVIVNLNANNVAPESEVEVRVLVSSREPINAFDITLEYSPELFELVRASTGRSIVSFWKSLPIEDKGGVMRFIGGMIEPFSGENGEIITLVFRARRFGAAVFVVKKADFAFADGKGTLVRAGEGHSEVVIAKDAELALSELKLPAPQISEITLTKDPATKNPIVSVKTKDDGGIQEVRVRTRSWFLWSDWQKAQLTASIPKYAWAIQLKAFGWGGQEADIEMYRWHIAGLKLSIILAVLAVLWYAIRKFASRRKTVIAAIIFIGLAFSISAQAATLSLSPASGTFSAGSTFEMQVLLDTEGETINALDVRLLFPPDKLQVISPSVGTSILSIWTSPPKFDNQKGEIMLQGGIPNGISASKGLISTISFRVRQTGTAAVRFGDASRVLLNDGKGTDVLRIAQSGVYEFVLPPPAGPIAASETHPDQTQWYANSAVVLRWTVPVAVNGYSYVLDQSLISAPDNTVNSTQNSVAYRDLSSGTHYFHIKALGAGGAWGGVTHFVINIDVQPPAKFPIEIQPDKRTTKKTILLSFQTTDAHSGIDRYEYKIIPLTTAAFESYAVFWIETQSPQTVNLEIGEYDIIVRAFDKAENFQENQQRVKVMTSLVYWATNKFILAFLFLLVILLAYVARRIYAWHRKIENQRSQKELPDSVKQKLKDLDKYRQKYGVLVLLISFLFGVLLFAPQAEAQTVEIAPPIITTAPQDISNQEIFYLGGVTELPNAEVIIYMQNLRTGEAFSYSEIAGKKGEWFYRHPSFLSEGEYVVWTQVKLGDITSPPSPQINVKVIPTAIQFGASRLSYETLYLLFSIILFLAFVGLLIFTMIYVRQGLQKRRMLKKEISEAEQAVRAGFAKLHHDIEVELGVIKRVKMSKELAAEEKEKEERLLKDLEAIEKYISKEVGDIERVAK